jgi:integrase
VIERHGTTWRYDFVKHQVRYKKGGYRTKQEAIEAEAKARVGAKRINTDFLRLCNSRLEELEIRRSKGHFQRNKMLFENLMKHWGTNAFITSEDVEIYLNVLAKESKHKANVALRLIRALFNHGIRKNWFDFDPTKGIEPYGIEKKKKYIPPVDDIEKVISLATPEQRDYLTVISLTLARVREINNLKWEDVNFEEGYLILKTRKARNSDLVARKIPMTKTVEDILSQKERVGEYVFINPRTGTKYNYRDQFIKNLCKNAKVKPFMYHALRHYGASKLSNAGVALTDIQTLLGHQRATTTDEYLQSIRGSVREAIKKLEE